MLYYTILYYTLLYFTRPYHTILYDASPELGFYFLDPPRILDRLQGPSPRGPPLFGLQLPRRPGHELGGRMWITYLHLCMHRYIYNTRIIFTSIWTTIHVCMYVCKYVCMYVCMYVCIPRSPFFCLHTYICMCMYVYNL